MLRNVKDLLKKKKETFVNKNRITFQISRSYHGLTMFLFLYPALKMFSYLIHNKVSFILTLLLMKYRNSRQRG